MKNLTLDSVKTLKPAIKDILIAKIIGSSIFLGQKKIKSKLKEYEQEPLENLYVELNNEIITLIFSKKEVMRFVFSELKRLPRTKKVLIEENLIIQLLTEFILRRKSSHRTALKQKVQKTAEKYLTILEESLFKDSPNIDDTKETLLSLLVNELS